MTNYEKIKNMSLDEMADFIEHDLNFCTEMAALCNSFSNCSECYTKWLESEVTEE